MYCAYLSGMENSAEQNLHFASSPLSTLGNFNFALHLGQSYLMNDRSIESRTSNHLVMVQKNQIAPITTSAKTQDGGPIGPACASKIIVGLIT